MSDFHMARFSRMKKKWHPMISDRLKHRSPPIELEFAEDGYGCCYDEGKEEADADAADQEEIK